MKPQLADLFKTYTTIPKLKEKTQQFKAKNQKLMEKSQGFSQSTWSTWQKLVKKAYAIVITINYISVSNVTQESWLITNWIVNVFSKKNF